MSHVQLKAAKAAIAKPTNTPSPSLRSLSSGDSTLSELTTPASTDSGTTVSPSLVNPYLKKPSPPLPGKADGQVDVRPLGRAKSTVSGRRSSLKFFDYVAQMCGAPPFDRLTAAYLAEDNLERHLWNLGSAAVACPIAHSAVEAHSIGDVGDDPTSKSKTKSSKPGNLKDDQRGTHYVISSILNFMGGLKNSLREKFPDHKDWPRSPSDNPEWYSALLAAMEKEFKRNKQSHAWSGARFGNGRTRSLYSEIDSTSHHAPCPDEGELIYNWFSGSREDEPDMCQLGFSVDLKSINRNLFVKADTRKPETFRDIGRNILSHQSVMRGGEIKFAQWNDVYYDLKLHAIAFPKHQSKTLTSQTVALVPHQSCPFLCSFFALGLIIGPGQGLRRTNLQVDEGLLLPVFPSLYVQDSSAVCRKITSSLQSGLIDSAPDEVRQGCSQKSMRSGAVTELSMHPASTLFTVAARSGHSTGTNVDSYLDPMKLERSMPGAKILAGHANLDRVVQAPVPWWIDGSLVTLNSKMSFKPQFERMHRTWLAGGRVELFYKGKPLHMLSQILLCVQIMHYADIRRENPHCHWTQYMNQLARDAELTAPGYSWPEEILVLWSDELLGRFNDINDHLGDMKPYTLQSFMNRVDNHHRGLQEVKAAQRLLNEQTKDQLGAVALGLNEMSEDLKSIFTILGMPHTPSRRNGLAATVREATSPPLRRSPRRRLVPPVYTYASPGSVECVGVKSPTSATAAAAAAAVAGASSPVQFNNVNNFHVHGSNINVGGPSNGSRNESPKFGSIVAPRPAGDSVVAPPNVFGHMARQSQAKESTAGTILLRDVLKELHENGGGKGIKHSMVMRDLPVPKSCSTDKARFMYVMDLCQFTFTAEQRQRLEQPAKNQDPNELIGFYQFLEISAVRKLLSLNDKTEEEIDTIMRQKKSGAQHRHSVNALGKRVKKYKNWMNGVLDRHPPKNKADPSPLMERWWVLERAKAGTPPGNTSMRSFYAATKGSRDNKRPKQGGGPNNKKQRT